MNLHEFTQEISAHLKKELPFVLYAQPTENMVQALLQNDNTLHYTKDLSENGFVMAPFDFTGTASFIPEKSSVKIKTEIVTSKVDKSFSTQTSEITNNKPEKDAYLKKLEKAIETIKNREAKKIVLSRYKDFELQNFSIETLINQLLNQYPTAFRYIWYHPHTGIWCGATPETLVQVENQSFKTMALAGTQPYKDTEQVEWGPKELDEQQLVTNAITNNLQQITSILKVSKAYTHRAGSLLHLKTDIEGVLKKGKTTLAKIANVLHPTPAVGGAPTKFAKNYIIENESYNRSYYTGFLGPITNNGATASLMVNLRCMEINDNISRIYVGGGITIASQPLAEWQETQNKMQTMLQVLAPML